jgi:hypothetical protein
VELHSAPDAPVFVQKVPPRDGHVMAPHAPAGHWTSHLHEDPQLTGPQALDPVHATLHEALELQVMALHAFMPVQLTVHATPEHWMALHALPVEQVIEHDRAVAGHVMSLHALGAVHWIVHA